MIVSKNNKIFIDYNQRLSEDAAIKILFLREKKVEYLF
jgi:hypothetical protein